VTFMENQLAWHYKSPNPEQLQSALKDIKSPESLQTLGS